MKIHLKPPLYLLIITTLAILTLITITSRPKKHLVPEPSEDDFLEDISKHIHNLPKTFFSPNEKYPTCGKYPQLTDIHFAGTHWQQQKTSEGTLKLFGAYYDGRQKSVIRVLLTYDRIKIGLDLKCQMWYGSHADLVDVVDVIYVWHPKWGNYRNGEDQPFLISCPVDSRRPDSVSVVEDGCVNATNNLGVFFEGSGGKKFGFGVCVKGLDFPDADVSVRLIEWLELVFLLGGDKVVFYELQVHENVKRVLGYYERKKLIEVVPYGLPAPKPNYPPLRHLYLKKNTVTRRQLEVIPYNDCLYRNINKYNFITLLDTDEIIIPTKGNWHDFLRTLTNTTRHHSYCARNVYFLDTFFEEDNPEKKFPKYLHILQHIYRTANYTKPLFYTKCFHDTGVVEALHNHYAVSTLEKPYRHREVDVEFGQLQHYRRDCVSEMKSVCEEMKRNVVRDDRVWRYGDEVAGRVGKVLRELGFV